LSNNRLRALIIGIALFVGGLGEPARAEWRRAETPNFIVYSAGNEQALRRYVRNLEIYDYVLRIRMGLPLDRPAARKLPIYLVNGRSGLAQIHPGTAQNVAGTYFPTSEDIFAAAIQDSAQDYLLHEYFHHFSFQLGSTSSLPGWLTEGLAEYFMTAEIKPDSVAVGGYNEMRVHSLFNAAWLPLEELLTKRPGELRRGAHRDTYYPVAWLMTHWFMSDDTRRQQLLAYIADLQQGEEPVAAMERATGLTIDELRHELRLYRRLNITTYRGDFPDPEITLTTLPRSADDLLLVSQRLKVGVPPEEREETAALVRRLAARHPDDPFAMLQLGHAELHFGDPAAGEAVLARLLETEPDNIEALQLLAAREIDLAEDQPETAAARLRRARDHLARAYRLDEGQYSTLHLLARLREGAAGYPTENDLVVWDRAFRLAPQLNAIRLGFAGALMKAEKFDEAVVVLRPLANASHGGSAADAAALMLALAQAGQAPMSEEAMAAAAADAGRTGT
jgi:hypothetical protein